MIHPRAVALVTLLSLLVFTLPLLVAWALISATARAQEEDLDCDDFATHADAQAVFNRDTSDPHNLDADGDGLACENNFVTVRRVVVRRALAFTGAHPAVLALAGMLCLGGSALLRRKLGTIH